MSRIVIFGVGRGANVATRYFQADSAHEIVAYTVDDAYADRKEFMGRPVIPFSRVELEAPPAECRMFIPLGFQEMNALRAGKYAAAKAKGYSLESYVSSRIVAWDRPNTSAHADWTDVKASDSVLSVLLVPPDALRTPADSIR